MSRRRDHRPRADTYCPDPAACERLFHPTLEVGDVCECCGAVMPDPEPVADPGPVGPLRRYRTISWVGTLDDPTTRVATAYASTAEEAAESATSLAAEGNRVLLESWDEAHTRDWLGHGWQAYAVVQPGESNLVPLPA